MSIAYTTDRAFGELYIRQIRMLVGFHLLSPSSLEQDTQEAADLVVLRGRDQTIACRVRRPGYSEKYPGQFTMRSKRDSGTTTEFQKILEGWGDWFFYGHAKGGELKSIYPWWLIDLAHFRFHWSENRKRLRHGETPNGDGTHFRWFDIESFPPQPRLLIAKDDAVPVSINGATNRPQQVELFR